MEESKVTCYCCGKEFDVSDMTIVESEYYVCPDCLESRTVVCCECGDIIFADDNAGDSNIPLCESCYDYHDYHTCSSCGAVMAYDEVYHLDYDDENYCEDCYNRYRSDSSIDEYDYKPDPIFFGSGTRYFGVELEIDEGGSDNYKAEEVMAVANKKAWRIYCKHDGSLYDGFEIVTHPMTLDYHMNEMPWKEIVEKAKCLGYLSHQAGSCGLHIHVNRNSFGDTERVQEAAIARVLYFFEKHWDELLKFSRRTESQLNRWAARYGYKDTPKEMLEHAKKGNMGRYACVNLCNEETIEFRIFRGTLKLNTLLATIQLTSHICDVAYTLGDDEISQLSWTDFVREYCTEPELIQYLKERQLYINDPVTTDEEV